MSSVFSAVSNALRKLDGNGNGVIASGPVYDGRAFIAAVGATLAARRAVAAYAARVAQSTLSGNVLTSPTGAAEDSVVVIEHSTTFTTGNYSMPVSVASVDEIIVTSNLATYGPWLEGTGSRNTTTRFAGYHSYRQATQEIDTSCLPFADAAVAPFVVAMNL